MKDMEYLKLLIVQLRLAIVASLLRLMKIMFR